MIYYFLMYLFLCYEMKQGYKLLTSLVSVLTNKFFFRFLLLFLDLSYYIDINQSCIWFNYDAEKKLIEKF
jgi:hypothetical protein